ncbi:MAG: response regulator [Candidatus Eisenbacteria bacterium]|nr:response regulator [Candidatus Eisenbacteria bacterium]
MAKSILIVDDERLLARTLSKALKEAGYKAAIAATAEQAEKQIFSDQVFDLVVLDYRLPKSSGLAIVQKMREQNVGSRVILMTAFGTPEVRAEARRLQVDKFIRKPFDLTRMLNEISDLVGAPEEPDTKEDSYRHGRG